MSAGQSRRRSQSSALKHSQTARPTPPPPTLTPENTDRELETCAATASFFLYAQRNVILCLHHDTLAIERRFTRHLEDILWISVDTVSERGAGRLAVSYDAGQTTIVWDILTGDEVARFAAYEQIRIASWMRNGNLAFGNSQGNVILFEPTTSEHVSARTIFDPITALAPATDCQTFAIGYQNGSILIATLQPFIILHTLTTPRGPARITGLAWHGSSTKQKSEMLATQTADGDLRVWSIPKVPHGESPNVIRILNRSESQQNGPCWFAWSKNGRIVQHTDGETRAWDVRTKMVTCETIPTIDGVTGIANFGPASALFTLGHNHTVQQYDISPGGALMQVATAQHVPANTPPSPPISVEERKGLDDGPATAISTAAPTLPASTDLESSESEGSMMSPLQKIAREMDQLERERQDIVGPLSPTSSRTSSLSSRSSGGKKAPSYRYDKSSSSRASDVSTDEGTEFSLSTPSCQGRESMSIRSVTSQGSSNYKSSRLRKDVLPSPDHARLSKSLDLFPNVRARLLDVAFRTPHYGQVARTADVLRREMLSVVFGWNDDVEFLIRDELSRHVPGSASSVLLSKWLGDLGTNSMASMIGSESMTSSDWMLLALSSMGHNSQKKVGQAFVQRLLEKGDVHPAAAILLGLGEQNDAIEVYVSRAYFMEAVLLTCLLFPSEWQRQSYLVRKWGEVAMAHGLAELAVRCYSCTGIDTSEPWFSPRAQDAIYDAQKAQVLGTDTINLTLSSPSATASSRMTAKNAALKLITTFGEKGVPLPSATKGEMTSTNVLDVGVTPIAQSAISPGPIEMARFRPSIRKERDPSSARTATPGSYSRQRLPSRSNARRARQPSETPLTAARDFAPTTRRPESQRSKSGSRSHSRGASSMDSSEVADCLTSDSYRLPEEKVSGAPRLPSPSRGVFGRFDARSSSRNGSREMLPHSLQIHAMDTLPLQDTVVSNRDTTSVSGRSSVSETRRRRPILSPVEASSSLGHVKSKAMSPFISSLEQAKLRSSSRRAEDRLRTHRKESRSRSRLRSPSEIRRIPPEIRYIRSARRSPTSPVPMSPDEVLAATRSIAQGREHPSMHSRGRELNTGALERLAVERNQIVPVQPTSRLQNPEDQRLQPPIRGRSQQEAPGSAERSPSVPLTETLEARLRANDKDTQSDGQHVALREHSSGVWHLDQISDIRAAASSHDRERLMRSRSPQAATTEEAELDMKVGNTSTNSVGENPIEPSALQAEPRIQVGLTRKQLAALELEDRRLSLARRPSAPAIPMPGEAATKRPPMVPRYYTELGESPHSYLPPLSGNSPLRSRSADPDSMMRFTPRTTGTSTPSAPIGLPATPRAMRHPRYMSTDPVERESMVAVSNRSSDLFQLDTAVFSSPSLPDDDQLAPLLPSTVFGQKCLQGPLRAASAPPERSTNGIPAHPAFKAGLPRSNSRGSTSQGHARRASEAETQNATPQHSPELVRASIDQTLHDSQVVVVDVAYVPPMLPELQHLAGPPPPPPPPTMLSRERNASASSSGIIDIAIDDIAVDILPTTPLDPARTGSPSTLRRGRGSVSEGISSRLRSVTGRMRSTSSGSRTKSPPIETHKPSPYESVPPMMFQRRDSISRTKSPYESSLANISSDAVPIRPPPPPQMLLDGPGSPLAEQGIPSDADASQRPSVYRPGKDVQANISPEQFQQGAQQLEGGLI